MKNLSITLFLIFVLLFVVGGVSAQDMASLRQRAEEIVKTKNPDSKLIRKYEQDKRVTYLWGNEKSDVRLTIFYGDSEQEAVKK